MFLTEAGWRISQATGKIEPEGPDGTNTDVSALYWRDINVEREVAFLRVTKTTPAVEVPLDPETLEGLKAWRKITRAPRTTITCS